MNLYEWAIKWGIPAEAVTDLRQQMGMDPERTAHPDATTEAGVSQRTRLHFAESGGCLWRNNVGAFKDEHGNFIRFGLANESSQMNKKIKSSDLIGISPLQITQHHVGQTIGQFVAIETKAPNWTYRGTEREAAQMKFLQLVIAKGGIGYFKS